MKKKNSVVKIILLSLLGIAVAAMVILPFVLDKAMNSTESTASILSVQAENGEIKKTVSGAGTLTDSDSISVTVPEGVEITEYLVEEGQYVEADEALAKVDKVTVMETISLVQETLDYISEEMTDQADASSTGTVTASNGGRVMAVYAEAGDNVREVMQQHGCLALISIDGYLDLRLENSSGLRAGDTVTVKSDSLSLEGKVEKVDNGVAVVLVDDSKLQPGETVEVFTADGSSAGTGELEIHSELRVTCYSGTVKSVSVTAGKTVSEGATLFKLDNTDTNAAYNVLAAERREYEDLMGELFKLYQDGVVKAEEAGCVTGIDDSLVESLAYGGSEGEIEFLAYSDADNLDLQVLSSNYVTVEQRISAQNPYSDPTTPADSMVYGYVLSVNGSTMQVIYLSSGTVTDITNPDTSYGAVTVNIPVNEVYYWGVAESSAEPGTGDSPDSGNPDAQDQPDQQEESWQHTAVSAGYVYVFGINGDRANPIWMVRAGNSSSGTGDNTDAGGNTHTGGFSGFGSMGTATEEFEQYEIAPVELMQIVPQEELTVTITIDEADILLLKKGMDATITLDALPGRSYSGSVTEINTTGENSGGSTKYTATVSLARDDNMLAGMNASCLLTVESYEDILVIPSEALAELDGKTVVYTDYDEKAQELVNPVEVTTGVSDGSLVQILSGIDNGATVWYSYYDTLPQSFDFGNFELPGSPAGN